jgi:hypothetical protein
MARKPKSSGGFGKWVGQLHWSITYMLPVFLLLSAMGTAAATWDRFGWWKPASVQYVDGRAENIIQLAQNAAKENQSILRDLQVEAAEGKRDATSNDIAKWQLELSKAHDDTGKSLIQQQINTLNATKQKLESQIGTLNRLRGQ